MGNGMDGPECSPDAGSGVRLPELPYFIMFLREGARLKGRKNPVVDSFLIAILSGVGVSSSVVVTSCEGRSDRKEEKDSGSALNTAVSLALSPKQSSVRRTLAESRHPSAVTTSDSHTARTTPSIGGAWLHADRFDETKLLPTDEASPFVELDALELSRVLVVLLDRTTANDCSATLCMVHSRRPLFRAVSFRVDL